jgi:transposase
MKLYKLEIYNKLGSIIEVKYYKTTRWLLEARDNWAVHHKVKMFKTSTDWKEMN